ncbi:MAG: hypothetical protein EHM45_17835 [Desulfobacteraceae bacterium]|nr:MAG: hypothetical protein EHM45_17835 [Desulfobacteraceae bacterium]
MASGGFSIFLKSLKAAFVFHWNLLFLGAAAAVGVISGWADIVFPLAGAVEILYLAVLASNTRFQNVVEARALQGQQELSPPMQPDSKNAGQIIQELSLEDRRQFEKLQGLCQELRQISEGIKGNADLEPSGINNMQLDNMNRLLWIYLKLLYSKTCLENFFRAANEKEIRAGLTSVQNRLTALGPEQGDGEKESKTRRSLQDTFHTLDARLKNYQNAKENYDFLQLELERLYSKIAGIVEMGINRRDSALITSEIDVVSSSVMQTEKTMQELESITGFTFTDEKPPALLKSRRSIHTTEKS